MKKIRFKEIETKKIRFKDIEKKKIRFNTQIAARRYIMDNDGKLHIVGLGEYYVYI